MLNFYQINEDSEIQTRDRLVIKTLIPYQRINSTQKLKLLNKILEYNLYYSLDTTHVFILSFLFREPRWFIMLSA